MSMGVIRKMASNIMSCERDVEALEEERCLLSGWGSASRLPVGIFVTTIVVVVVVNIVGDAVWRCSLINRLLLVMVLLLCLL